MRVIGIAPQRDPRNIRMAPHDVYQNMSQLP